MKIKISNSVIVNGGVVMPGTEIEVDVDMAKNLYRIGCAEEVIVKKTPVEVVVEGAVIVAEPAIFDPLPEIKKPEIPVTTKAGKSRAKTKRSRGKK